MVKKETKKAQRDLAGKRSVIIVSTIAATVAIGLIVTLVAFIIAANSKPLNYLKDDLSKYVYVSESEYKNFPVKSKLPEVDADDVERKIISLLYNNRAKEPILDGAYITSEPISVGDVAYVLYRGYTVDQYGVENDIDNSSTLVSGELSSVGIGELKYVQGFEEGLIGVIPKNCVKFEQITEGTVEAGDVMYLSYTALYPNGTNKTVTSERVELSADWLSLKYGKGFAEYFVGKKVGERIKENKTFDNIVYYDMKIDFVTRCEDDALTVSVHFPEDYSEVELRGVDAKFDIYVEYAQIYETPEYNDAFVTDVLGVKEEELSEYEDVSASVSEKYRLKIEADLLVENEKKRNSIIEEDMWEHLRKVAKVEKLPEPDVAAIYNEYYNEVYAQYESYKSAYSSVDEFALKYFSLSVGADWKAYIRSQAESVITEKLIFYYIVTREGFLPTDEEFDKIHGDLIKEYVDFHLEQDYKGELEKCKTEEERAAKLAKIEGEVVSYYGENYFAEMVYYEYAMEKLVAFAALG